MGFVFGYTGLRVRDLDAAIDFFTKVLDMKLEARVNAHWNKGEFANLVSGSEAQTRVPEHGVATRKKRLTVASCFSGASDDRYRGSPRRGYDCQSANEG